MRQVAAVFIDLVGASREPSRRNALQQRLTALRERLNREFSSQLQVPFQIVWGDELKGVLDDVSCLWSIYQEAFAFMDGAPFYYAVGLGTVDTPLEAAPDTDIDRMDGTAFKAARQAIDRLKEGRAVEHRVRFRTAHAPSLDTALNAYVDVINDLLAHMTPAQRRHFKGAFPAYGRNPAGMNVSRQAVWEALQRARVDAYEAAVTGLSALLDFVQNGSEDGDER